MQYLSQHRVQRRLLELGCQGLRRQQPRLPNRRALQNMRHVLRQAAHRAEGVANMCGKGTLKAHNPPV